MKIFNNFFTSGWEIPDNKQNFKSKYQMLNVGIILSSISLIFGMISNYVKGDYYLIYIESVLIAINIIMFFLLRINKKNFNKVVTLFTMLFASLFLFLMYSSEPSSMKHVWLFTFPIVILFYEDTKKAILWLFFVFFIISIAPFQPFVVVHYSLHQTLYILFVVSIVAAIMYIYKVKIDEAKQLILEQQNQLLNFNIKLANQVEIKTSQLRDINESLEVTVQEKIEELIQKDKILTMQSKQAVMGEMITMIAHQWRQPLSSITLQISNLELKSLLGEKITNKEVVQTLSEISDTIIYLSDTIDDFQTYFHPNKELTKIGISELFQKVLNFVFPRLKDSYISIKIDDFSEVYVTTYMNELIQVILNLLNNSIDALIGLDTKEQEIKIRLEDKDEKISIYVSDNANGISKEVLPHIFEPYFSTKGKNGTGLGLYMSQMIIQKQFNGELSVESSQKGSTFIVTIPKIIFK